MSEHIEASITCGELLIKEWTDKCDTIIDKLNDVDHPRRIEIKEELGEQYILAVRDSFENIRRELVKVASELDQAKIKMQYK